MKQANGSYGANSMQVLEGLDPVRKRPGMYIGSTGPSGLHHCVWEVVDNSVDEAMAGHASRIDITLLADGGCRVTDDGRGIPTDVNKQQKMTGVEIALTKLHGGGKFGGEGYKVSGGLHGVGRVGGERAVHASSSSRSTATASTTCMEFADGGKATGEARGHRRRAARPHRHHRHLLARRHGVRDHSSSPPARSSSGCR